MRRLLLLLWPLACASSGPTDAVPGGSGEDYEQLSSSEASQEFDALSFKSEQLGLQLSALQEGRVPDEDPRSIEVAVPLGETLGRMYTLCVCNDGFSETAGCESWRSMFEEQFDL